MFSKLFLYFSPISTVTNPETQKTPWRSIWLCNVLQLLNGIQFSILFTSMWPFLKTVRNTTLLYFTDFADRKIDSTADLNFYGWITAIFPLGQTLGSFLFGLWDQKSKRAKDPTAMGVALMGVGNLLYGILPVFKSGAKWIMLIARFVVGFGSGNLSVLRSYVATGARPEDRVKALSIGFGMFVLGLSLGPVVMLIFTPLGPSGFYLGTLQVSMYNLPAFSMVLVGIVSLLLLYTCFQEVYAGIITVDESKGYDKRKMICFGMCVFILYHLLMLPWPFYRGMSDSLVANTSAGNDCLHYDWCKSTKKIPLPVFIITTVVFTGMAFSTVGASSGALFSEVLGPRNQYQLFMKLHAAFEHCHNFAQGFMQGLFAFFGSAGRFVGPIISTAIFQSVGYMVPMLMLLAMVVIITGVVIIFHKRLVPLSPVSAVTELEARKSPWFSIWLCNILQLLNGIQFSILFTSMWPYLRILDSSADLNFYGWIVAVFPLGQTIGSFLFGVWNQKTKSAKHPTAVGVIIMGVGNLLYGTLPLYRRGAKWAMLIARTVTFEGNLSVLRTYVAVGAAPKDRVSALSFGIALFVLGLSIGPVAMVLCIFHLLMFTPLGEEGFYLGALRISMYNLPAWAMVIVALVSLLLLYTCFQEKYAGILTNKDDQGQLYLSFISYAYILP
ncbi:unnamed protein product [Anisakis simplex]|uniref:MFS domain-containing protein n=1 Tax=Anisakis simplex TaxID=6269 RepID=A0A0M3K589_ANISI|nr:unnamed protein product [Anisakis simplex]